jgi:serine/threonine protein kinase
MPEIGQTISHYRLVEKIGQGGMGEVYLADDTTLDRKVALKFLPEAFISDPERMARFEREAKLLASLNHPNIAGIYGLEQADGNRFLVLEYVEGETLHARLSKGALPLEDALELCRQIAEGLETAHEKGVIHRDFKPANVMITAEEKVKILDFGLAKALADEAPSIDRSQSPTITETLTQPGVLLGTAAYMSPEQAQGKSVDKRADIWAFGCILYECLTGKKAFEGKTVTETLAAVIKEEPDWRTIPATTPSNIRFVLHRCLNKERNHRYHHVADLRIEIEEAREISKDAILQKHSWLSYLWAAIATLLVITLAVPSFLYFQDQKPSDVIFFQETGPSTQKHAISISPDGRVIAYVASSGGERSLFIRKLGSTVTQNLNGTEGADRPFWSPDSRYIAFCAGGILKRIDISGGLPRDICEALAMMGGTWNSDGIIVFNDWPILKRVSAEGGEPSAITALDQAVGEFTHMFPSFLPDGHHFLYFIRFDSTQKNGIYLGSIDSNEKTRLITANSMAIYAEPGYLLYQRERTLFAQKFDKKDLKLMGDAISIADELIPYDFTLNKTPFCVSNKDVLIYRAGEIEAESQFVWFDRTGKELGYAGDPGSYQPDFDLSPDGKQITVAQNNLATGSPDIKVIDCARNVTTRLTFDLDVISDTIWFPDSQRVLYSTRRQIFEKKANGVGEETLVHESSDVIWPLDISTDGQYIVYGEGYGPEDSDFDLLALPLFGDREPLPVAMLPADQDRAKFSFDGKWVAYGSNESGTCEIYVTSFPALDQKCQISTNGGVQPHWRRDGKELYYLSLDGKMMVVAIKADSEIIPGIPEELFNAELIVESYNGQYDVTSDGQRFIFLKPREETALIPITVVLNWEKLLEQ